MSLELSFQRDLLYMAVWLWKKWGDICYMDFYTGSNPTNDIDDAYATCRTFLIMLSCHHVAMSVCDVLSL